MTKPVKEIKTAAMYSKLEKLKQQYLSKIMLFWEMNTWCDSISMEDIQASNTETRENFTVTSLTADGVEYTTDYEDPESSFEPLEYKDLCIEDLDMVVDLINNYIEDFNKTLKRCEN